MFPYRYAGLQLLALEEDGICEYGERSVVRHAYGDFEKAVYTPEYVCLMKGRGGAVMIPMEPLAQIGGIKMLFQICNERGSGKPLSLKQKKVHVPAGKWGRAEGYWLRPQLRRHWDWRRGEQGAVEAQEQREAQEQQEAQGQRETQGQRRAAYRPGRQWQRCLKRDRRIRGKRKSGSGTWK